MLGSLKIITAIAGVTGLVGGVTYVTLKQTGDSKTASFNPFSAKDSNCIFIDHLSQIGNLQVNKIMDVGNYTAISCYDAKASSPIQMESRWIGWIPKNLFTISRDNFEANLKAILEMDTKEIKDSLQAKYQTTFTLKGEKFLSSPLVGKWEGQSKEVSNQELITVKMDSGAQDSDKKFYLFFLEGDKRFENLR